MGKTKTRTPPTTKKAAKRIPTSPQNKKAKSGTGKKTKFSYDAVVSSSRRLAPKTTTYNEDIVLGGGDRRKLVATVRDQRRNFAIVKFMVQKHLDYVSRFTFQAKTGDQELDKKLESVMKWWSVKNNCDSRRKHSLQRMLTIGEASRVVDGDVFFVKLANGRLQALESDRITWPTTGGIVDANGMPILKEDETQWAKKDFTNGVYLDSEGIARLYIACTRKDGSLKFERLLPAQFVYELGYYGRFDQERGVSPLSAALNTCKDLSETLNYQLIKAKMHALFGVAIYQEGDAFEEGGGIPLAETASGTDDENAPANNSTFDARFKAAGFWDLNPGEKVEMIESKTPSNEFQNFTELMIRVALLSLDIPYTFYDSRGSSYSAMRQDLINYNESAKAKREDIREFLRNTTTWKLFQWTLGANPLITLPAGMNVADIKYEWVSAGIPWIDPLKEIKAYTLAVQSGLASRQYISKLRGWDWFEMADQLAEEEAYIAEKGITVNAPPQTLGPETEEKNEDDKSAQN